MNKVKIIYIKLLKKSEVLTSLAILLTKYTGKSDMPRHPKYLINNIPWFFKSISSGDEILDIGCGTGNDSLIAAKTAKFVTGLDISKKNIKVAIKMAKDIKITNVKFAVHDANYKLPFSNNVFDKILMFDVLEHLNKRDFAVGEAKRVLKTNGLLLLITDNPDTSWKKQQKSAGLPYYADIDHKYEYSKKEISKLLNSNGFKILSVNTVTYNTPLKPLIDLAGGFSLSIYKKLTNWRIEMANKFPNETTGFQIIAKNIIK